MRRLAADRRDREAARTRIVRQLDEMDRQIAANHTAHKGHVIPGTT